MNADIKAKWVAALRSGEYTQGKNQLRTETESGPVFCCLGVLCDLHQQVTPGARWTQQSRYYTGKAGAISVVGYPPDAVRKWAGLSSGSPDITLADGKRTDLSNLNDVHGATFAEIATLIEEQL